MTYPSVLILLLSLSFFAHGSEDGIILYDRPNFKGRTQIFTTDAADLRGSIIGNDQAVSVLVPHGWTVTLFEHEHFKGQRVFLKHSTADLQYLPIGRNQVSSLRITKPESAPSVEEPKAPTRGDRGDRNARRPPVPPVVHEPVILYKHSNFRGKREAFTEDDPNLADNKVGSDEVTSIQVPPGCVVTLFEHTHYRGRSETFEGDDPNLKNNLIGNDRASSIQIRWAPREIPVPKSHPPVVLFTKYHFKGWSDTISESCPDLSLSKVGDDNLGSIHIPLGYRVTLYEDKHYRGRSEVLLGDDASLRDNRIGVNAVSSIKIEWVGAVERRRH